MKKIRFIDEFEYDNFEDLLFMQNKFLINGSAVDFYFRIINYSNGVFKLKVYCEE